MAGEGLQRLCGSGGHRWLGFSSVPAYAKERLGRSGGWVAQARSLGRRLSRLPKLREAVLTGQLSWSKAEVIAAHVDRFDWIDEREPLEAELLELAPSHTVRQLRALIDERRHQTGGSISSLPECLREVLEGTPVGRALAADRARLEAAEAAQSSDVQVSDGPGCTPPAHAGDDAHADPDDDEAPRRKLSITAPVEERDVMSGKAIVQMSDGADHPLTPRQGVQTVQLSVADDTARFYRALEREYQRHVDAADSFLRFLGNAFAQSWRHLPEREVAYCHIYRRDRHRCASPTCERTDVTPHHLKFRSQGGGEEHENLISLCTDCHLWLLHEGHLFAEPPASDIHWKLGSQTAPIVEVRGRERLPG